MGHPSGDFLEVARAETDLADTRLSLRKGEDGVPLSGDVEAFFSYWQLPR